MSGAHLPERSQALVDAFYLERDRELLAKIRTELEREQQEEALAAASGITDRAVLQRMIDLNIDAKTLAAFSLAPLVVVAWADGHMDDRERQAILEASEQFGVKHGGPCQQLLAQWLSSKPQPQLLEAWKEYARTLVEGESDTTKESLRHDILDRAEEVAQAAGGLLGMGSISGAEKKVLQELRAALS